MKRKYTYRALASGVIVVAVMEVYEEINDDGKPVEKIFEWTAYIGSVLGMDHQTEWQEVSRTGDKLQKEIAQAIFPFLCGEVIKNISYRS